MDGSLPEVEDSHPDLQEDALRRQASPKSVVGLPSLGLRSLKAYGLP